MKSGQKLARYAAEATSEVVGRRARVLGLKAVVMKVNGFTHFRRKRQVIMSWLEVRIEDIVDDDMPENEEDPTQKLKKKKQAAQMKEKDNNEDDVSESEDEDGFPISAAEKGKSEVKGNKAHKTAEEAGKIAGVNHSPSLKRKVESADVDEQLQQERDLVEKKKKKKKKNKGKESQGEDATPSQIDKPVENTKLSASEKKEKKQVSVRYIGKLQKMGTYLTQMSEEHPLNFTLV
ncbi:hypothetical protein PIB30_100305 [Stylosanthes scabra]|uniref:Uncharacterized protein n=1 Tax=Stylosanthes scabra TaxID=79078 RepID=A0ABU6VVJ2_9FABA|nr:hypothetical protein [Stylosanthes scabra]